MSQCLTDASGPRAIIRGKVIELARRRGVDAHNLRDSDAIPEVGGLESLDILELIMWYETTFNVSIPQEELTLENFGTVDAMAGYLRRA